MLPRPTDFGNIHFARMLLNYDWSSLGRLLLYPKMDPRMHVNVVKALNLRKADK